MATTSRDYGCPVEFSLELLRGKWKPVIMARLKQGPMRYGQLRRAIPRLSDKVLTERLRDLEASGLVASTTEMDGAVRIYRLSKRGMSLKPVLQALYDWGEGAAPAFGATIRPATPAEE
jgi:DNA-binding HxlR family transcriptional regulator